MVAKKNELDSAVAKLNAQCEKLGKEIFGAADEYESIVNKKSPELAPKALTAFEQWTAAMKAAAKPFNQVLFVHLYIDPKVKQEATVRELRTGPAYNKSFNYFMYLLRIGKQIREKAKELETAKKAAENLAILEGKSAEEVKAAGENATIAATTRTSPEEQRAALKALLSGAEKIMVKDFDLDDDQVKKAQKVLAGLFGGICKAFGKKTNDGSAFQKIVNELWGAKSEAAPVKTLADELAEELLHAGE